MVPHPREIYDLHRREILDSVTRDRLAALACDRPRGAGFRPKRLPRVVLVAALFVATLLGLAVQYAASGTAQAGAGSTQAGSLAATGRNVFVGAWRFTDLNFDLPSLVTLTADGNVLVSNLPVEPVPPEIDVEMLLLSAGVGVWEAAGADRANFTYVYLYVDETGTSQRSATLSGVLELADNGQALSGEYGFEVREPKGSVVHSYTGAVEGTRIGIITMDEIAVAASPAGVSTVLLPASWRGPR